MTLPVRLSPDAAFDLKRLAEFLVARDARAALRATEAMINGVESLETFPDRGRGRGDGTRELVVAFGRYAYIVIYRVDPDAVLVVRIFHSHEDRTD